MTKTVLLTGGLGYIGSVTAHALHDAGYKPVIIDALVHHNMPYMPWATVIKGDIGNSNILHALFKKYSIEAVMHFAGLIEVGESVKKPALFYQNNVAQALTLLDVMRTYDVSTFIFSSSCAVYGNPVYTPMDEQHPFAPVSPYGKTKLAVEYILQDYAYAYGLKYISLRYFNAAGALPASRLGECHDPETHVIPLLLRAAKHKTSFTIFGSDYNTPDGTCIRDYIHVEDIAHAHVLSLKYLEHGGQTDIFNLGTGTGHSVNQLVAMANKVCQVQVKTTIMPRRAGDADVLVANATKARKVLRWIPRRSDLEVIMRDAWEWELGCSEQLHLPPLKPKATRLSKR